MALSLTEEQVLISNEAQRFLQGVYNPQTLRTLLQNRGAYDNAMWRAFAEMGWTRCCVPEAYGGLGLGPCDAGIIAEQCGRFVTGAPFLASTWAAAEAVQQWGEADLKTTLLPAIADGEARVALAIFDDAHGLRATPATTFTDGLLTGMKKAVACAGAATHALVYAMADAPMLALADLRIGGSAVTLLDTWDNSRCTGDLRLDGVPAVRLHAPNGFTAALDVLARAATVTAFEQIGGAEAAMDRARAYANERHAFGQPIGRFQAVKHRIAEMYVAIELARGNAMLAAAGFATASPDSVLRAAAARLTATHAYDFAASESIQTHGAIGVTWEHDLHLHLRRARTHALELGGKTFWEDVIVDALEADLP